jgi:hypothetical protein
VVNSRHVRRIDKEALLAVQADGAVAHLSDLKLET